MHAVAMLRWVGCACALWAADRPCAHLLAQADEKTINLMLLDGLLLPSFANIPAFCLWACVLIERCLLWYMRALLDSV